jgi:hypothetical protein
MPAGFKPSDGRIEIDNNSVERTIMPIALDRKNALFAGHDAGPENWAIIASLIETCKLNTFGPTADFSRVFAPGTSTALARRSGSAFAPGRRLSDTICALTSSGQCR